MALTRPQRGYLASAGVREASDFAWQAQLRYYWESDTVIVRMLNAVARYGFEYLGNSARLVITPLTDRCYRCAPACRACALLFRHIRSAAVLHQSRTA